MTLTQENLQTMYNKIQEAESKARANTLGVYFDIEGELKRLYTRGVKTIILGPSLFSKSKRDSTTCTVLTVDFYKNGKVKSIKSERLAQPNFRCYKGYNPTKVLF